MRDELGVVREVGVHDDDKVARNELEAVHVGGSETELACSRLQLDMGSIGFDELVRDFLCAVGGAVVDDNEFPVEFAAFNWR